MRTPTLFLLIMVTWQCLQGQQVTGFARDDQGKPLVGASVILKKDKDSSVVKLSISDSIGRYVFSPVAAGRYFVSISHVGFLPQNSVSFESVQEGSVSVPETRLPLAPLLLKQSVIETWKPIVEVRSDRVVLNVESNINSIGSDALELLRKSPGITVDKDNNITLEGKTGVQIFIDGRPSFLTGTALAGYLQTLPSTMIGSIEIIPHPSSAYEAAGSAGIIDIRLRKNLSYGTNMTVSAGYDIGTYGKYNGAVSFNHRDRYVNIYGDYAYNYSIKETYADMYRAQQDTAFFQHSNLVKSAGTHTYRAGLDWLMDNRNTLGVAVGGSSSSYTVQTSSTTPIVYVPDNTTDRLLQANNHTDGSNNNVNADLNYRYADSTGHDLKIDLDYGVYHLRSSQLQPNNYFDSTGKTLLYSNDYLILSPTDIRIYSAKADYETNLAKGRLSIGWKSSYVTTSNVFQQYDIYSGGKQLDSLSSNVFDFRENINALYADYDRPVKDWDLHAGLRAESTWSKGTSTGYTEPEASMPPPPSGPASNVPYDSSFIRHYTDLFPHISVTWKRDPAKQWTLSYSRRIDRPDYQDLNPFVFKIDDYTFARGNTLLLPQYTNSVGLAYRSKNALSVSLNYSHTSDLFAVLADTTDGSKLIDKQENLASQDVVGVSVVYPFNYKWYTAYANVTGTYVRNKADFGLGRQIDLNVFNATIYSQHTFRLGRGWTGQLTQYYTSPNIWQATLRSRSLWNIDLGMQKTILNGNGSVKVAVSDIFNTLGWSATSEFAGQYIRTSGGYESRLLKLYFTWRFGNRRINAIRRHDSGDEEENKRVGSGTN